MFRLYFALCLAMFTLEAPALQSDYCSSQAWPVIQAHGGDPGSLSVYFGVGTDRDGYTMYKFKRGEQLCYISYSFFSYLGGIKCSSDFYYCPDQNQKIHRRHR